MREASSHLLLNCCSFNAIVGMLIAVGSTLALKIRHFFLTLSQRSQKLLLLKGKAYGKTHFITHSHFHLLFSYQTTTSSLNHKRKALFCCFLPIGTVYLAMHHKMLHYVYLFGFIMHMTMH